jgi:hypothetical protein
MPAPMLKPGQFFRMHDDCGDPRTYEVLRVSSSSARVRPVGRQAEAFTTADGEGVRFSKPHPATTISATASVVLVPPPPALP